MNPQTTPPQTDDEPAAPDSTGFDWQRYKNDRRELHEKLVRDDEIPTTPTPPDAEDKAASINGLPLEWLPGQEDWLRLATKKAALVLPGRGFWMIVAVLV